MRKIYPVLLAFLALILSSCSGIGGLKDVLELKTAISDKFDAEKVEVSITNEDNIEVSFNDADLSALDHQKKQEIATEVGRMALEMKPEGFKTGTVNFVQSADYLVVTSTDSEAFDMFPEN